MLDNQEHKNAYQEALIESTIYQIIAILNKYLKLDNSYVEILPILNNLESHIFARMNYEINDMYPGLINSYLQICLNSSLYGANRSVTKDYFNKMIKLKESDLVNYYSEIYYTKEQQENIEDFIKKITSYSKQSLMDNYTDVMSLCSQFSFVSFCRLLKILNDNFSGLVIAYIMENRHNIIDYPEAIFRSRLLFLKNNNLWNKIITPTAIRLVNELLNDDTDDSINYVRNTKHEFIECITGYHKDSQDNLIQDISFRNTLLNDIKAVDSLLESD